MGAVGAALFRGVKGSRHLWMRLRRRASSTRKSLRTRWSRSKVAFRTRRALQDSTLRIRQLAFYAPPDERRDCPCCGSIAIVHIEPLSITRPASVRWKYGFISGCRRCGVLFANPLPSQQELDRVYSPAGDWGRHRQDEQEKAVTRRRVEWLFAPVARLTDVLRPSPGMSALDFGCGLGGMLDALADLGWQTSGIEPATDAAFRRHQRLTMVPADAQFDLVLLNHVLEHVTAPLMILRQLARATRLAGVLLVRVPNLDGVATHGDLKYCIRSNTHVTAYSTAALRWLLAEAGFSIVEGGVRTEHDSRHLVVLAQKVTHPQGKPPAPLNAARTALRSYAERPDCVGTAWRPLPVRTRAAVLNMTRGGKLRD